MESPAPNRRVRNVVFVTILVATTIMLATGRLGSWFGDDVAPTETVGSTTSTESMPNPPVAPLQPFGSNSIDPKPETTAVTFLEFAEQYDALRDNFRARDSLTALVVDKHVQWEGYVRNVTRFETAFYVNVSSAAHGYNGPSASITFGHELEDHLYALHPDDFVRFEGVVTRAAGSVGIEGMAIEAIE